MSHSALKLPKFSEWIHWLSQEDKFYLSNCDNSYYCWCKYVIKKEHCTVYCNAGWCNKTIASKQGRVLSALGKVLLHGALQRLEHKGWARTEALSALVSPEMKVCVAITPLIRTITKRALQALAGSLQHHGPSFNTSVVHTSLPPSPSSPSFPAWAKALESSVK